MWDSFTDTDHTDITQNDLPYVKNTNAAAMADLVTVNAFNAFYRESVGIIHINGILTV